MRHYSLTHNNEYNFIDLTDNGETNFTTCDNCGALIRYVVHLIDKDNKNYFVGTECTKTLLKCKINNDYSMREQILALKKVAIAKNLIKANNKVKIFRGSESVVIVGINKNNKPMKIYIKRVFDPFLNKYYSFIDSFLNEIPETNESWCFNDVFEYLDSLKQ